MARFFSKNGLSVSAGIVGNVICNRTYMSEDVHQTGWLKCVIVLLISQSVYLFSYRDIVQMTTARWRHGSHYTQAYHTWPIPTDSHTSTMISRVIRLRRMTTVSPSSCSRLKKIDDSSRNVTGRKR